MGKAMVQFTPEALVAPNNVQEIASREMPGGDLIAIYINTVTKDVFAELMGVGCGCNACGTTGIFRQWLLEPVDGKIDIPDILEHPYPSMYARKSLGYLAVGEYE